MPSTTRTGTPAGWIANRNSLIAATFGVLALITHDSWRRNGRRGGIVLAPALLTMGLFSKEEGITACACFLLRAMARPGRPFPRVPGISPVRRGAHRVEGTVGRVGLRAGERRSLYGSAEGTGPIRGRGRRPGSGAPAGPVGFAPLGSGCAARTGRPSGLGIALARLTWLLWVLAPLLRRDRTARFWAGGMLLAVVPLCAMIPMDRILTAVGIGALACWRSSGPPFSAAIIGPRVGGGAGERRRCRIMVVIRLVIAPLTLPITPATRWDRDGSRGFFTSTPRWVSRSGARRWWWSIHEPGPCRYLTVVRGSKGRPVPAGAGALARVCRR